jgi:predicted dinucleotide-binding enzyme
MRIAIIGAGNVGGTLGKAWAKKGHEVFYGVREPQEAETQELLTATGPNARAERASRWFFPGAHGFGLGRRGAAS